MIQDNQKHEIAHNYEFYFFRRPVRGLFCVIYRRKEGRARKITRAAMKGPFYFLSNLQRKK